MQSKEKYIIYIICKCIYKKKKNKKVISVIKR